MIRANQRCVGICKPAWSPLLTESCLQESIVHIYYVASTHKQATRPLELLGIDNIGARLRINFLLGTCYGGKDIILIMSTCHPLLHYENVYLRLMAVPLPRMPC
jgi:hypothetical protein